MSEWVQDDMVLIALCVSPMLAIWVIEALVDWAIIVE